MTWWWIVPVIVVLSLVMYLGFGPTPPRRGVQVIKTKGLAEGYAPPSAALGPSPGIQVLGGGNEIHKCRMPPSKVQALRIDVEDMRDAVAAMLISGTRILPTQCRGCNLDVSHPLMRGALDDWGYCLDCAELRNYQKR